MVAVSMQTLALLHTVRAPGSHADLREPEPALRELSPAADAACAAGVRAMLAHEAALKRGAGTVRCTKPDLWYLPSVATLMCRDILAQLLRCDAETLQCSNKGASVTCWPFRCTMSRACCLNEMPAPLLLTDATLLETCVLLWTAQ